MNYLSSLHENLPQVILTLASVLVLFLDFAQLRRRSLAMRSAIAPAIAILGCTAAAVYILHCTLPRPISSLPADLEHLVQCAILGVTACVLLLSVTNTFTDHPAEFSFLILLSTIGMMFLVDATDLLTFFISLELLSLSLYALTAFNKNNPRSAEAALRYFLFGGISAAFLLFGFSFVYGATGSIYSEEILASVHRFGLTPLLVVGLVCTLIGFGFKVAAAPFHFWAPDAYEGAPAPAAAFIASSSKVASFTAFFLLFGNVFAASRGSEAWGHRVAGWAPVLELMAIASMVLGNLVALRQTGLRRLIAYSAIAHTGYILLSVAIGTQQGFSAMLYYVITYAIGTVGLFAVLSAVEITDGSDSLANFNGLVRRSPLLATCLFIFLLSLAGIPPLSGFFAKFYIFLAVLQTPGHLWLVIIALATSAVALYYYLQVLKRALLLPADSHAKPINPPAVLLIVSVVTAAAILLLGIVPGLLLTS